MPFSGFGCSVDNAYKLADVLAGIADAGFSHAEIRPLGWDLWADGKVNHRELARHSSVLEQFTGQLSYTMHAPYDLNLFDDDDRQARILRSSVEVARALGAEVIVVHPGRLERYGSNWSAPMTELMARERRALLEIADKVSSWDGLLALETWFAAGAVAHSYAVWPANLARQVALIAHPRIGVCLDTGHLQLSARWFGFDFDEAVRMLAPLVAHVHFHENFATLAPRTRMELGQGDMHLPPGWGDRSFSKALAGATFSRGPILNVEISGSYLPHLDSILAECKRLAAREQSASVQGPVELPESSDAISEVSGAGVHDGAARRLPATTRAHGD